MPPTDEDIAWLRSSFHPVPRPQLPDDCVEYSLYIVSQELDPSNDSEARVRLRDVQKAASDLQKKWLKDYIWQRRGFGLELVREDGEVCHAHRLRSQQKTDICVGAQVPAFCEEEQNMVTRSRTNGWSCGYSGS